MGQPRSDGLVTAVQVSAENLTEHFKADVPIHSVALVAL